MPGIWRSSRIRSKRFFLVQRVHGARLEVEAMDASRRPQGLEQQDVPGC
jgi:hypothetical protein